MKVADLYKKYDLPQNLIDHMLSVAGVTMFIKDHWMGEELNWQISIQAALLHDVGNIVKFDFEKHSEFISTEKPLEYWKEAKAKMIAKYGDDDHEVTKKILLENKIDERVEHTIQNKSFANSVKVASENDWYTKVLFYSDLVVLPWGVGSLELRIDDVKERMPKYTSRPDFDDLVSASYLIRTQIQKNLDSPLDKITSDSVSVYKNALLTFEI